MNSLDRISRDNKGEDWMLRMQPGLIDCGSHDQNLFWPLEQMVAFAKLVTDGLTATDPGDVGLKPNEPSNQHRLDTRNYADAIPRHRWPLSSSLPLKSPDRH
jgi:hypothetical protein